MELKSRRSGSSTPKRRGPNQPRLESQLNTGIRQRNQMFGQNTSMCKTGSGNLSRRIGHNMALIFLSISFLLSFTFNAESRNINVSSHNLHGFKSSSDYLKSCINDHGGIWMGQEHWLSNKQLHNLQYLNTEYIARSGMEDAVSSGVLRGRPFGGVCIAWASDLNHAVIPLAQGRRTRACRAC